MPRRKKLDLTSVTEALMGEIEERMTRVLNDAMRDLHQRIDKLERSLVGKSGRDAAVKSFKVCRKPGCNGRVIAHGLCSRHYQQWRYHKKKAESQIDEAKLAKASRRRRSASISQTKVTRKSTRRAGSTPPRGGRGGASSKKKRS